MSDFLSFKLPDEFVNQYEPIKPNWGFSIGGGNSLSELTYYTKYSRKKEDGTKERWFETCRRIIEGFFSILKDHCKTNRTSWNENKAVATAKDAYDRLFYFKWSPPGRGLQHMGSELINNRKNSAPLLNCAFLSTGNISSRSKKEAIHPFVRLMEMSMNGIGVGFDTDGADKLTIYEPNEDEEVVFVVPDTREGWAESEGILLVSYFFPNQPTVRFDYSKIRDEGKEIKGFGGVAPGHKPLLRLHESIRALFLNRHGSKLSSEDIVDINNLAGKAVVSGGNRRTAELALGEEDDKNFLNLKNWELNPKRMGPDGWGHLSNNSIKAKIGNDYSFLVDNIAMSGEPGLIWLDLLRSHGRLGDPADNRDYRVKGVNPCQPGWATVLTPKGISTIDNIQIGDEIWSSEGWTTVLNKWSTGKKDVYKYSTTTGSFYGTENHRLISNGKKIEAKDCKTIDNLAGPNFNLNLSYNDIMDGLVFGDGSVHKASNNLIYLCIGENDKDYFGSEINDLILHHRPGLSEYAYEIITSLSPNEIVKTYDRKIPNRFFFGSQEKVAGFLRGLYSANGSIVANRVTLKASSFKVVEAVQIMLSSLGIRSYYTTNKSNTVEFLNGLYDCKQSYDINISTDRNKFYNLIGFIQNYKMDKLKLLLNKTGQSKKTYPVNSIKFISQEEVFDITVNNESHTYWTGGLNVSNCAEQQLESEELCTLVNVYPTRHETLEDYFRSIKIAYMYGKAVTLLQTPWPESNEVMNRNRRIGLSMSGLAQFAENRGWHELKRWMDLGFTEVKRRDVIVSEWLGVRESIRSTTVKPDGTTGIVFFATPGAHWQVERTYIRRIRFTKNDPLIPVLQEAGYNVEPDISDPDFTVVVEFPTMGHNIRTEREVSIWEKTSLAVLAQRYWSDNAVSCTVTFMPHEKDQIASVLRAYDGQLKTISFLPIYDDVDAYQQSPYSRISDDRYEEMIENIKPINWHMLYDGKNSSDADLASQNGCTTDKCEVKLW